MPSPSIVVHGAGLIGGFLGGALAAAGAEVTLLGRPHVLAALAQGLTLTDLHGLRVHVAASQLRVTTDPACLASAELVLVCVKSSATAAAAAELAAHARPGTVVVSFQNGVRNAEQLQHGAPQCRVLAGMVPFNVMQPAPAHLHRATDGALYTAPHPSLAALRASLARCHLELATHPDMRAVRWSKLLMNLNNAINALSGVPLLQQLADRGYRRVLAACIREGLACLRAAGIEPVKITKVGPSLMPHLLRLPTPLYVRLARRTLRIDEQARSSMAEDLAHGRRTEIDELNGAVVRLGREHGTPTPVNEAIIALIRAAEAGDPRRFSSAALRRAVRR